MSTVLDALRKAEQGRDRGAGGYPDDLPPEPPRRGGPRWLWVLLALVALVGAFAGGLELSGGGDDTPEETVVAEVGVAEEAAPARPAPPVEVASAPEPALRITPPERTKPKPRAAKIKSPARADLDAKVERQTRVPVDMHDAPPESGAPQMSEKRRKILERVMDRRKEREERRANRLASREESQGLREAIRSATNPEEREALLAEFREIRRIARAERKAAAAERRVERVEQKVGDPAPEPAPAPAPRVAAVARPEPAPAPALAPPPEPPPAPAAAAAPRTVVLQAGAPADEGLRRPPSGAPQVRINILQWSNDPGRRFAYMSIEGNPAMTQVREGESFQGLTVTRIYPETVEFAHEGSKFLLRAN